MGGYALISSKILHFFWRLSHRRVFQRRDLYRPKITHDKTEQGPDLGLFFEVHFLENLAVIEGPNPEGKNPLKQLRQLWDLAKGAYKWVTDSYEKGQKVALFVTVVTVYKWTYKWLISSITVKLF